MCWGGSVPICRCGDQAGIKISGINAEARLSKLAEAVPIHYAVPVTVR